MQTIKSGYFQAGKGKIIKAQRIAKETGMNPNTWSPIEKTLFVFHRSQFVWEIMTCHLIVQGTPGNPQNLACTGAVSPGMIQGPDNQFLFHLRNCHTDPDGHLGLPILVLADTAG
jgi:hypothetical protein